MQPIRLYRRAENWPRPVFAEQTQRGERKNEKLVQTKEEKRSTLFETHFEGISNPNFESFGHSLKSDEIAETGSSKMAKSATVDLLMTVARRIHAAIQLRVSLSKKLNALRVRAVTTAR